MTVSNRPWQGSLPQRPDGNSAVAPKSGGSAKFFGSAAEG
jgi:hypothetical protein